MRKFLIPVLIVVLSSGPTVYAATDKADIPMAQPKEDVDRLLEKSGAEVPLKDDREVEAKLHQRPNGISASVTPESLSVHDNEVNSVAGDSAPQTTPSSTQTAPKRPHHSHHLRNILIGFAACFALAVVIAVASK